MEAVSVEGASDLRNVSLTPCAYSARALEQTAPAAIDCARHGPPRSTPTLQRLFKVKVGVFAGREDEVTRPIASQKLRAIPEFNDDLPRHGVYGYYAFGRFCLALHHGQHSFFHVDVKYTNPYRRTRLYSIGRIMQLHHADLPTRALTPKEYGQFKCFARLTPPVTLELVTTVGAHWTTFIYFLAFLKDVEVAPQHPSIAFLLTHRQGAFEFHDLRTSNPQEKVAEVDEALSQNKDDVLFVPT